MIKKYPYLEDSNYIDYIDREKLQTQYTNIIVLDWKENPIQEIQGLATAGSISINGQSAIRRTCNITIKVKENTVNKISDVQNLLSINKKIFLEIGKKNRTSQYTDYPILWFPQGVFIITSCSITSNSTEGITISLQLKDKMCLLNGECGGTFTSAVQFDKYDTTDEKGNLITIKPTYSQIIRELVNHFGEEQLGKILISDLPERIKQVMRWMGSIPIYIVHYYGSSFITTDRNKIPAAAGYTMYESGQDIGYTYTDFVFPSELVANAGDNICTILDKVKNSLGNYEYFYDIWGNFKWQEIKNYLNTTQATTIELNNINNNNYMMNLSKGKSVYNFKDSELIISYSNTPNYTRIKNDFVVWGIKRNNDKTNIPIRYHLAIDKKPEIGNIYEVFFYYDEEDGLTKAKCPIKISGLNNFPIQGVDGLFYMDTKTDIIYKWDSELTQYIAINGSAVQSYDSKDSFPKEGESNVIYLDESTGNRYVWDLNINSAHYQKYDLLIKDLKDQYQKQVAQLNKMIENIEQTDIQLLQRQIDAIEEEISPLTLRKQYLERQLSTATTNLEYKEAELQGYNDRKEDINGNISVLNNRIEELNTQIAAETDPDRRAILIARRDICIHDKEEEQEELTKVLELINLVNQEIQDINTNIQTLNENLSDINNELAPYQEQLDELNAQMAVYEGNIAALTNQINELTVQFNMSLNSLQNSQKEYILFTNNLSLVKVQTTDWRSELYLQGAAAEPLGLASNYYYPELSVEWPKIYDLRQNHYVNELGEIIYTGGFLPEFLAHPYETTYFLDFIDNSATAQDISINNIGRRSIVENKNDYNCVFEAEVPDYIIIELGQKDTEVKRHECEKRKQPYLQVDSNIYRNISIGGLYNSCFNQIKNLLWDYINYNNNIQLSAIPIYHLEPNTRISILNTESDIYGDYMMNSISIPLTINGTMTINAQKVFEKL